MSLPFSRGASRRTGLPDTAAAAPLFSKARGDCVLRFSALAVVPAMVVVPSWDERTGFVAF